MTRCTVCGATSREGARFCTSCGTQLVDEQNGTAPDATISTPTPTESPAAGTSGSNPVPVDSQAPEPDRYISSWPSSASDASSAKPGAAPAPGMDTSTKSSPEEASPLANENASWPAPAASNVIDANGATSAAPNVAASRDQSGATDGSAPPSPASGTSRNTVTVQFERLHDLLDEMQRRIERINNPATVASRGIDPDDLADQLDRWSRAVPDTDALLESVRQVRRSPKDIDALRQLSDRAADLELLVRHYQSITSTSDQWAADLRRAGKGSSGE